MQTRDTDGTTIQYDESTKSLSIEDDGGSILNGQLAVSTTQGGSSDKQIDIDVELTGDDAVVINASIVNHGETATRLGSFEYRAASVAFGSETRIYEHGYQSWSPTASLSVGERFPTEDPDFRPMMLDLDAPRDRRSSSGLTGFVENDRQLVLGFLNHDRFISRFDIDDDANGIHDVRAVCPLEGVLVPPNGRLEIPPLRIDASRSLRDGLEAAANAIGEEMNARFAESVPTGWCSWYHYFTGVTEADVRENVRELAEWDVDVDVVQIDDGYMEAFGDWRSITDGFDDMAGLASDIETAGYTPGLWLAPFYTESGSDVVADHPEWFVSENGELVDGGYRDGSRLFGLDTTHPEVETWLRETFSTVVEEWGFDYLKLDFLFGAALPGDRYDTDATRAEAYRRGLEIIRDVVGEETFILGCGAPITASVGLVDAMRIGPDVDPVWDTAGDAASQPALKNAVRNTLNRQFFHRRLWLNDPDCQLVRETTDLTDAEREAFAALVAMTGGVNVFSDRLAEIDPTGRRLLERSLPPVETGQVVGIEQAEFPDRVVCERPGDDALTVGIFNWEDESRTVTVDPSTYIDDYDAIWDGIAGAVVEPDDVGIKCELPSHGAAIFSFIDGAPPRVTGDADTLTGGSARITEVLGDERSLSATIDGSVVQFDVD
jgi:alpha-galactosidase